MQSIIKNITVFTIIVFLTSCSKEFLDENFETTTLPVGLSNIYISPKWQTADYLFKLSSIKKADYEIVSKPSWLNVSSLNGHIADSIALIQCSVTKSPEFKSVGIYMDFMTVKADGKNYKVPVAYITEGSPKVQIESILTLSNNFNNSPYLPIQNMGLGILIWNIKSMPDWLVLDANKIESKGIYITPNSSYNIPFLFKPGPYSGNLTDSIVLSTNDKEHPTVTINVKATIGIPQLNIYTKEISFSYPETTKTLSFSNNGNGTLVWELKNIPEWLTITPSSGSCNPYSSESNITLSCDRTKLSVGQNTATIILKTNDSSLPSYNLSITASAPGITKNIRPIDGNIVDAVFNKNTNTLYYVTSLPNKFVAYDVVGRTVLNEISLSKAPTSFAISEDWTKAAVGHDGSLSAINIPNNKVTATYSLNYSVNDIAWAENDWFCYTQNGGNFTSLHWINTADGSLYEETNDTELDSKSVVKKVPNQPFLIATRNATSPSGFIAYDIATKSKKSYAHMDLTNFWFSENGDYIFAQNLNVYRTTSSTETTKKFDLDIPAISKIKTGNESYFGLKDIYHSDNYLWILQGDSYLSESLTQIYQLEDNDYTLVKKYNYDIYCQTDEQTTPFKVSANFIFANKEGTEIGVLCKGISNNTWVIQFMTVK